MMKSEDLQNPERFSAHVTKYPNTPRQLQSRIVNTLVKTNHSRCKQWNFWMLEFMKNKG